jgi:hypothetical protein
LSHRSRRHDHESQCRKKEFHGATSIGFIVVLNSNNAAMILRRPGKLKEIKTYQGGYIIPALLKKGEAKSHETE